MRVGRSLPPSPETPVKGPPEDAVIGVPGERIPSQNIAFRGRGASTPATLSLNAGACGRTPGGDRQGEQRALDDLTESGGVVHAGQRVEA